MLENELRRKSVINSQILWVPFHELNCVDQKVNPNEKPKVHKDLDGFDIKINSFGEIQMSYDMDKINQFLNQNVEDKKLKGIDLDTGEFEEDK